LKKDVGIVQHSVFSDMSLTKEEHLQVVNKLGKYLEKMTPQEIPPFIYQLLRLCKHNNSRIIFLKLQQYFGLRYNENLANEIDSNSDSTQFDIIEDASNQDIMEAESTVLYHIHTSASLGHECIKDYLASLKNVLRSPEYIIHPFQLSVLLTISTISHYEEKVFEIVRSCISRTYHEEQKKNNSAWFRDMVPASTKIETVFAQVIIASAQDRDLILQGLVNFAFVLLGVGSALGRDLIAEKQWHLGTMILLKIIKRKRHTAPIIIEQLSNRIVTEHSVSQYIECLYMLSKNLTLLMLDNKSKVVSLMEGLIQMPGHNAQQLLDAIIPLTKVSPTIRDHFILLLRKALYSRVTETRQVAVIGFLKLLTNLKISNLGALSQGSFSGSYSSGHSLFTQISINRTTQCVSSAFSNEALCLEILSILKRCFMQQAEVRTQLYAGLYEAVCLNPELGIPTLEMIWMHFRDFYNIDDETLPPLKFEKITITRDVNVSLQEPLGKLIYTIGLIVTKVAKVDSENAAVVRFGTILESICSRMIRCELVHFELVQLEWQFRLIWLHCSHCRMMVPT
jgi:Fanconi anemia group I protein